MFLDGSSCCCSSSAASAVALLSLTKARRPTDTLHQIEFKKLEHAQELDPEEERALAAFMAPPAAGTSSTAGAAGGGDASQQPGGASLGDLIVARLRERQAQQGLEQVAEPG